MKKSQYILILGIATVAMTSCTNIIRVRTSKDNITREIAVTENFTSIQGYNTTDIEYVDGPAKITLTAPDNVIDKIHVNVKDGVLTITQDEEPAMKSFSSFNHSKLTVSYPGVNSFGTFGTGDINIESVKGDTIYLISAGTGDIESNGFTCSLLNATTAGTGDIELKMLKCEKAYLSTDGTGDIEISNIDAGDIMAKTNGTGDVTLKGSCRTVNYEENGTGDVSIKGLKVANK